MGALPKAVNEFVLANLQASFSIYIFGFLFVLVGLIHVISRTGGILGAIRQVERLVRGPRSAKLAVERTGQMFAGPLLEHYSTTLAEIRNLGFLKYWTRQFRPYLQSAASQFSPGRGSLTQRLLGKSPR